MKNNPQSTGKNYLFAIAIEEYTHLTNAPLAVQKVETLIKTLQSKYQVPASNTTLLANESATLEQIFQHLETLINQLTSDDRLIIIFSGWGDSKKLFNQSYWIPVNAQEGKTHQYLSSSELIGAIQSFKVRQILVISDTIYFPTLYTPFNPETVYPDLSENTTGHWLLASGASIQNGSFSESQFIPRLNNTLLENPGEYLVSEIANKLKESLSEEEQAALIFGHLNGVKIKKVAQFQLTPQLSEATEWAICQQENDLIAYNLFLQKYPTGEFVQEARQKLAAMQEEIDWENAIEGNTVNGYLDYKKKYRNGKYSGEADEKIALASLASFGREPEEDTKSSSPTAPKENRDQPSDYTRVPTRLAPKSFVSGGAPVKDVPIPGKKKERKNLLIPILAIALLSIASIGMYFKFGNGDDTQKAQVFPLPDSNPSDELPLDTAKIPTLEETNPIVENPDENPDEIPKDIEEVPPAPEGKSVSELMNQGKLAVDRKNYAAAISFYSQALQIEPENAKAKAQLSESRLLKSNQESYQLRMDSGNNLMAQRKYPEAISYYQRALKYRAEDPIAQQKIKEAEQLMQGNESTTEITTEVTPDPVPPPPTPKAPNGLPTVVNQLDKSMAYIKGGIFTRGNNEGEEDERPERSVTVGSFYMSKYEVTQELYQAVMGNNPSHRQCPTCPVTNVSWNDANTFIKNLNSLTGKRYRLPTETQWEYAAKGGVMNYSYKYAGSNSLNTVAWNSGNSQNKVQKVKQKSPTPQGIFDLTGNVAEWCYDIYDEKATKPDAGTQIISTSTKVVRGGSYTDDGNGCRVTNRQSLGAGFSKNHIGFRLVR